MLDLELKLVRRYLGAHPGEAARELERLPRTESATILADQTAELAAAIVARMRWAAAAECAGRMEAKSAAAVLCRLAPAAAATLLRRLPLKTRHAILDEMPPHWREPVEQSLRYPEGSVGALMDTAPREILHRMTVAEALEAVMRDGSASDSEQFVIDAERRLYGAVAVSSLLRAEGSAHVEAICHRGIPSIDPALPATAVADDRIWMDFDTVAVADSQNRLIGAIRHRRIREYLAGERAGAASNAAGTAYAFGELCWSGMAAALDTLAGFGSRTIRPRSLAPELTDEKR